MKTRLLHVWEVLTSSYWFVPTLIVLASIGLAFGMLAIDRAWPEYGADWRWLYSGGADGARALLSAVAGSIITVAGVVFSITIMTLTQASSQFGPRLLRTFMRDTANQVVLGVFLATFIYCLLVLRRVLPEDQGGFVPHISVTIAVLLAMASIAVLIYYIHHISTMLQAPNVVAAVGRDLDHAIRHIFPEGIGQEAMEGAEEAHLPPDFEHRAQIICPTRDGYIQAIDGDGLIELAVEHDLLLRLDQRPGQYAMREDPLLHVWPADRLTDRIAGQLANAFIIGRQRTSEQDVEYAIDQMVEIAVRALSAGINDPFTARTCVDWLGAGLSRIARQDLPTACCYDDRGTLRLLVSSISTFSGLADAAFDQIRQYGRGSVAVQIRLLEVIGRIGRQARNDEQRQALRRHLEMVHRQARETIFEDLDRRVIEERYRLAMEAVNRT
jgi:uncharacterized membrane protein